MTTNKMSEKKEEKNRTTTTAAGHKLHVCICGWKKVDLNKQGKKRWDLTVTSIS